MSIDYKYKQILKKIEALIGGTTTYDFQLDKLCRQFLGNKFNGIYPLDKIPRLKKGYYIINLDKSYEAGSHWCGIACDNKQNIIYDSFGRTHELKKIPELNKLNIIFTEDDAEQNKIETNCGQRCIAFILCHYLYGDEVLNL